MTREQAKTLLPVLTAFAKGEDVQFRNTCLGWTDADRMNDLELAWRVKPKRSELWICRPCRDIATYKPSHKCVCGASYTHVVEVFE